MFLLKSKFQELVGMLQTKENHSKAGYFSFRAVIFLFLKRSNLPNTVKVIFKLPYSTDTTIFVLLLSTVLWFIGPSTNTLYMVNL